MTSGKRVAPRRHAGPARLDEPSLDHDRRRMSQGPLLLLSLGITAALVAWGYLVHAAIDFGTAARNGDTAAWWLLALATVGAIACLFVALMLGTRLVTRFRATLSPAPSRPPGGRRAAR